MNVNWIITAFVIVDTTFTTFLHENNGEITLCYIAFDGHFDNIPTLEIVQRHGLHIITKLRTDSVLYLPPDAPYSGRERPKIFDEKVDVRNLPAQYCVQTTHDGDTQIQLFGGLSIQVRQLKRK
jgi:hypothetical protein